MASVTMDDTRLRGDTAVSLFLAAMIVLAWLCVHFASIFFINWNVPGRIVWAPVVIAVQCWLSVGLFIIAHDTMHGSLAPEYPRLNRAIGRFCVFIYAGFSYDKLFASHHAHHRYAGTADDPDFDENHPTSFWPWYLTFFRRYFGWREFGILTIAVLAYLIILRERFPTMLVFWALPAILSSIQLFYFGTFLPHRAEEMPFTDRHRARSSDFSPLMSLLTCFHFGYHHEHHDRPGVPWWRLPAQREAALRAEAS